jgi:hypothetical protein
MFLDVTSDAPNLYFVIDRSGSMSDYVEGRQKYAAVTAAAVALVRSLGSRANVGAAVFPGRGVDQFHPCAAGEEVFTTKPGDPLQNGGCGNEDGAVTRGFATAIGLPPDGATPTGATLDALLPTLAALKGKTVVLLATDGGPNCNSDLSCDETKCIPNIEGQFGCGPGTNCCAANGMYGPANCLDESGTRSAVASLLDNGIKTYVVGIPGSSPYAALLDELAIAGGTARMDAQNTALYYDVEHIAALDDALAAIAATVTLSCQIRLVSRPPVSGLVNVYLDGQLIKYGPDGWLWGPVAGDASADDGDDGISVDDAELESGAEASTDGDVAHSEIDLVGAACQMLGSGKYRRLRVVFGCPTDIPR